MDYLDPCKNSKWAISCMLGDSQWIDDSFKPKIQRWKKSLRHTVNPKIDMTESTVTALITPLITSSVSWNWKSMLSYFAQNTWSLHINYNMTLYQWPIDGQAAVICWEIFQFSNAEWCNFLDCLCNF